MIRKLNTTWFDFETTGLNINKDSPVSIYAVNYKLKTTIDTLINPEQEISIGASGVHGIYEDDVIGKYKFVDISDSVIDLFQSSEYIGGYNICKFDVPMLISLMDRNDQQFDIKSKKFIDVYYIIKKVLHEDDLNEIQRLNLTSVYKFITGNDLDAHKAKYDVLACVEILNKLEKLELPWRDYILEYDDIKGSVIDNDSFVMKSGKFEGYKLSYLLKQHSDYLKFMTRKGFLTLSDELCKLIK